MAKGETALSRAGKQIYRCAGKSYWMSEDQCNNRQSVPEMYPECFYCNVRKGGKDDPRKEEMKVGSHEPENM